MIEFQIMLTKGNKKENFLCERIYTVSWVLSQAWILTQLSNRALQQVVRELLSWRKICDFFNLFALRVWNFSFFRFLNLILH